MSDSKLEHSKTFWDWVRNHAGDDVSRLRLSSVKEDFDIAEAITQIECRQRFGKKLADTLSRFSDFFFPSTLSGEQATGDLAASFHSRLVNPDDTLVDLTSGLGIDVLHLARVVSRATAVERNPALCDALKYNAEGLNIRNIDVVSGDCRVLAETLKGSVAFIDPARRADDGSRVFSLAECEPDVVAMLPTLAQNFGRLIVKASPMLDIAHTVSLLEGTREVYAIGTPTECKELVITVDLSTSQTAQVKINAVTLFPDGRILEFPFTKEEEDSAVSIQSDKGPRKGDILYVPYPATMKAAPVRILSQRFGLYKFHPNTHLYFGAPNQREDGFPGEQLEIIDVIPWQSKNIKRFKSTYPKIAVSVRNFGMSADALRTKLGVREGGSTGLRLFGIGLGNSHTDRLLIVAQPLKQNSNL